MPTAAAARTSPTSSGRATISSSTRSRPTRPARSSAASSRSSWSPASAGRSTDRSRAMRLSYVTPFSRSEHRRNAIEYARLAESAGYDGVWVPEAFGSDAFTLLGLIAGHTQRLKLATGIVNVFSRSPALLAQTFATLDEISEGRAIIGLGTSGPI